MNKWVEKYGKVFGIYMMGKPALVVLDPKESFIFERQSSRIETLDTHRHAPRHNKNEPKKVLKEIWIKQFSKFFLRTKGGVVIRAGNSITGKVTRDFITSMDNPHQWRRVRRTLVPIMSNSRYDS